MSRILWLSAIAILLFNLIFFSYVISRILWLSAVSMFYFIYLSQLCDVEDFLGICSCKFWERKGKKSARSWRTGWKFSPSGSALSFVFF